MCEIGQRIRIGCVGLVPEYGHSALFWTPTQPVIASFDLLRPGSGRTSTLS